MPSLFHAGAGTWRFARAGQAFYPLSYSRLSEDVLKLQLWDLNPDLLDQNFQGRAQNLFWGSPGTDYACSSKWLAGSGLPSGWWFPFLSFSDLLPLPGWFSESSQSLASRSLQILIVPSSTQATSSPFRCPESANTSTWVSPALTWLFLKHSQRFFELRFQEPGRILTFTLVT